jgi:hypothetical protein
MGDYTPTLFLAKRGDWGIRRRRGNYEENEREKERVF